MARVLSDDDAGVEVEVVGVDIEVDGDAIPTIPRWWPYVAFALSLIGFGISLYLTIEHFQSKLLPCPANGFIDCTKVTTSKYSHVFGVPVALAGLLFYTTQIVVNFPAMWNARSKWVARGRLALAASGICFVLYLLGCRALQHQGHLPVVHRGAHHHVLPLRRDRGVVPPVSSRAAALEYWSESDDEA